MAISQVNHEYLECKGRNGEVVNIEESSQIAHFLIDEFAHRSQELDPAVPRVAEALPEKNICSRLNLSIIKSKIVQRISDKNTMVSGWFEWSKIESYPTWLTRLELYLENVYTALFHDID